MYMNDMRKRTGAFALLIVFVLVMLLSAAFILTHSDHEHDHNGSGGTCATCAQLHIAQNLLKNIASLILVLAALNVFFTPAKIIHVFSRKIENYTLVSLKVRLNN
jgi:hypothetical protein